jgi:YidC/Oxa1 family membrane protein insertase
MISKLFNFFLYEPFYNLLILLQNIPYVDAGIAIILLTIFVKMLILPLSVGAIKTQIKIKEINPLLMEVKEKYKDIFE